MKETCRFVLGMVPIVCGAAALAVQPTVGQLDVLVKAPVVEAEMEVATEGLTHEEYLARHAALNNWLRGELPPAALDTPVRVELTPQEIDSFELAVPAVGEPLQVGVVKPIEPQVQIVGLSRGQAGKQQRRDLHGALSPTGDGGFVWALAVSSANAGAIRVHLENFSLPDNTELFFYSQGGEAYGPYTGTGPDETGDFWTASVFGSEGVLQLRVAAPATNADLRKISLSITEIGHVGRGFLGGDGGVAAFCTYNANCIENTNCTNVAAVNDAENAVAKMLWIAGCCIYTCSGGLIADTETGSEIPYFLTANHCLSRNNHAANLEAFFHYQVNCGVSTCTGTFTDPPDTLISGKTLGATVKATNRVGDYTLLQLNQTPPGGSVFLGWNSTPVANSNGAVLHRVSHPSGAPQAYSKHTVDTTAPTCQGWPRGERIYSRDNIGATEGGSSGSPVVNADGKIVGQLSGSCGFNLGDECDAENNATVDGAFASYFSQVAPFLDPTPCTPSAEVCNDGIDNDCDGAVDCADSNCSGDPGCACLPSGASCTSNSQCCSNNCKGPPGGKTCK